jgi:hypothetical protein
MKVARLAMMLFALGACAQASACKVVPSPSTAELVARADNIQIVRVLRLEAMPEPNSRQVEDMDAIAVIEVIEVLKGRPLATGRLLTRPNDCGAMLWPGAAFLVFTDEPSAPEVLVAPGYGSFLLDPSGKSEELSEITAILTGNTNQ